MNLKKLPKYRLLSAPPHIRFGQIVDGYVDQKNGWVIQVYSVPSVDKTPWRGMVVLCVTRSNAKTVEQFNDPGRKFRPPISWEELQAVKDFLFPTRVAFEAFPPKKEIVDAAPMRWVWVLPEGQGLPFSISGTFPHLGDSNKKTS